MILYFAIFNWAEIFWKKIFPKCLRNSVPVRWVYRPHKNNTVLATLLIYFPQSWCESFYLFCSNHDHNEQCGQSRDQVFIHFQRAVPFQNRRIKEQPPDFIAQPPSHFTARRMHNNLATCKFGCIKLTIFLDKAKVFKTLVIIVCLSEEREIAAWSQYSSNSFTTHTQNAIAAITLNSLSSW